MGQLRKFFVSIRLRRINSISDHLIALVGYTWEHIAAIHSNASNTLVFFSSLDPAHWLYKRFSVPPTHIVLAAAYAQANCTEDAVLEAKSVLKLHLFFEVDSYGSAFLIPTDRQKII